jgi:hypothetical protein
LFQGSATLQQQNCAANQFPRSKPRFCKIFLPKEPFFLKYISNSDLILEEVSGFYASDQLKVTIERGTLAMICARTPNLFKRKGTCSFTDVGPPKAHSPIGKQKRPIIPKFGWSNSENHPFGPF